MLNNNYYIVVGNDGNLLSVLLGGETKEKAIMCWLKWNDCNAFDTKKWREQKYFKLKKIFVKGDGK